VTDTQIDSLLERLREYHGAERVTLRFEFDDGQSVTHVAEDRSQ